MAKYFFPILSLSMMLSASHEKPRDVLLTLKDALLPSLELILPIYKEFSTCYENDHSRTNYIYCTQQFSPKVEKVVQEILPKTKPSTRERSHFPTDAQLQALSWSLDLHKQTVSSIKTVSKQMKHLRNCLVESSTLATFNRCTQEP